MTIRTYTELRQFETLEERYEYLCLSGIVGDETFGSERWINQRFYQSREWKDVRSHVIARDYGMDLGSRDMPVRGNVYVHHINPLTVYDIIEATDNMFDPNYLISCSLRTHNAIHYGDRSQLPRDLVVRMPGDTTPWR